MKAVAAIFFIFLALLIFDTDDIMPMDLDQFQWKNRLLFLFAPDNDHPLLKNLQSEISAHWDEVKDRDLVVFEILEKDISRMNATQLDRPVADSIRNRFGAPQHKFTLLLVGKDGGIKMKRHDQANLKEVFDLIDSMPMRKNEMRQKKKSF